MPTQPSAVLRFAAFFAFLLLAVSGAFAQNPAPASRITQAVDNENLTVLKGNVYSLARPEFDRGMAPSSLPMERMTLVLRPSPDQAAALATLLDEQQDQSSPYYHKWLTPLQFGQQFGASEQDIQTITSWLQAQGFQVNHLANGRNVIEFSGTAGQVQQAFHTAIHKYSVATATGNEEHWANAADPQIPAALAPVVIGVATLHNFLKAPQHILSTQKFPFTRKPGMTPEFTGVNGNNQPVHAVTPGDLAIIYNANPLYAASPAINGTGSINAVVARSNVNMQDVLDFRNNFGVSGPLPQIVLNGPDPGNLGGGEEVEAVLDISYSGALAPQSTVDFVVSASTNTADGVDLSEMYIIDHNLGDVMTESFGGCEEGATAAEAAGISNLAEQAAAQGITYLVSTGDNGSAGCDDPNSPVATQGVSVNILASTPYTVGVGGTMFNEGANAATYWNTTNTASLASAKSYIPENVWNESCSVASCGAANANLAAGSGGVSILFPKPSWQSGVAGIPSTGDRNLPDVSLTAAGHDAYLICLEGSCEQSEFEGVAGTSASVQAFGGIMALVRQKIAARVGQADYVFYKLAATETLANCNGSKATPVPSTNCIFYDTTVGNNAVPGITNGDYPTTVGYDRATGLGSVNITNLVNQWNTVSFAPSVTTLTVTPTTFTHGASATFNITVAPKTGTPTFTNEVVELLTSTGTVINDYALSSTGTASGSSTALVGGSYSLNAHYPGNGTLGSSDSAPVNIVVSPETSTTVASALSGSPTGVPFTSGTYGTPIFLHGVVTGQSGVGTPTGTLTFSADGANAATAALDGTGAGTTSAAIPTLTIGSHTLSAAYSGDSNFKSSSSANIAVSITKGPTTEIIQPNSGLTVPVGTPLEGAVFINTTSQGVAPTGTVTLFAGTTQLGSPISMINSGIGSGGFTQGSASYSFSQQLPFGPQNFTVTYSGDSNYLASTSTPVTLDIVRTVTVVVSASPTTVQAGQNATFTASITSNQPGGPAIGGTLQFLVGEQNSGPLVTVANGQAQVTTSSFPAGGLGGLTGLYFGDNNYGGNGSNTANFTVTPAPVPDFVVSASPSLISVTSPGQSASTTMTIAGSNGFSGVTSFSCSGLPSESACVFSMPTVTGSGTTMLTVTTTAPSSVVPSGDDFKNWRTTGNFFRVIIFCIGLLMLGIQVRRRRLHFVGSSIVTLAILVSLVGCGGGGGGVAPTPPNPGTPMVQNQVITVTATSAATTTIAAITHTTTFTLNVN
jgi:Pro-kumamolisin, activation domain/Bacterial Ig-like domain (group 3)